MKDQELDNIFRENLGKERKPYSPGSWESFKREKLPLLRARWARRRAVFYSAIVLLLVTLAGLSIWQFNLDHAIQRKLEATDTAPINGLNTKPATGKAWRFLRSGESLQINHGLKWLDQIQPGTPAARSTNPGIRNEVAAEQPAGQALSNGQDSDDPRESTGLNVSDQRSNRESLLALNYKNPVWKSDSLPLRNFPQQNTSESTMIWRQHFWLQGGSSLEEVNALNLAAGWGAGIRVSPNLWFNLDVSYREQRFTDLTYRSAVIIPYFMPNSLRYRYELKTIRSASLELSLQQSLYNRLYANLGAGLLWQMDHEGDYFEASAPEADLQPGDRKVNPGVKPLNIIYSAGLGYRITPRFALEVNYQRAFLPLVSNELNGPEVKGENLNLRFKYLLW